MIWNVLYPKISILLLLLLSFFFIISVDNSNKTCIAVKWWYEYQNFINVKWNQRHDELTV